MKRAEARKGKAGRRNRVKKEEEEDGEGRAGEGVRVPWIELRLDRARSRDKAR